MANDKRPEIISFIKEHIKTTDDLVDLLIGLEGAFDIRVCVVTRGDVESEFEEAWSTDGQTRTMSDNEWESFRSEWFWRKGHSEIMWDGVTDAIRWDLMDLKLLPSSSVAG